MDSIISIKNLSKWYGQVLGVAHINLEIPRGITGLLGPNGSGKSTLLQLITGELQPSEGQVFLAGESVWNNLKIRSKMAYCPDTHGFYNSLTGEEFLVALGQLQGLSRRESKQKSQELLERLSLKEAAQRKISTYSRGMAQRLKFAQTLLGEAEIFLLDEPLQGTDPLGRALLLDIIKDLAKNGATILISSHVLHEIESVTASIVAMTSGHVIAHGGVEDLRALMGPVPRRISIQLDHPRKLAEILISRENIQGVSLSGTTLEVTTFASQDFLRDLPSLILDNHLNLHKLHCPDEQLEEVFHLLSQRRTLEQ